jgi:hypothetical protein
MRWKLYYSLASVTVFFIRMQGGEFTVKLTKLKIQGPSLARAPSEAPGGALNKYSLSYLILYL